MLVTGKIWGKYNLMPEIKTPANLSMETRIVERLNYCYSIFNQDI